MTLGAETSLASWRIRLLGSVGNTITTLVLGVILALALIPALRWAVLDATFFGTTQADCTGGGACWVFVRERIGQFVFGFYPEAERWRVALTFAVFAAAAVPLLWPSREGSTLARLRQPFMALLIVGFPVLCWLVIYGALPGLVPIETAKWGGLMLTLLVSSIGISLALPLGVLLALGRQSALPVIRVSSVTFIELWRGVPLITILFMASVMLPLVLPRDVTVDKLVRALVGITLFASAYMAEVVRGGLQMIPRGQFEAARAIGLSPWQLQRLIVLPQALRIAVPGIVNTFIGLVKDTSLILIVGMFDLLGMIQSASTHPDWLGSAIEGYVFGGLCFFVICGAMSHYSRRLELKLGSN